MDLSWHTFPTPTTMRLSRFTPGTQNCPVPNTARYPILQVPNTASMSPIATIAILTLLAPWAVSATVLSAAGTSGTGTNTSAEPPAKIVRYTGRLFVHYDTDGNGKLDPAEWDHMQGRPASMDRNQDGQITLAEMILHFNDYARTRRLGYSTPNNSSNSPEPAGQETTGQAPIPPGPGQDQTSGKLPITSNHRGLARSGTTTEDQAETGGPNAPFYVPARLRPNNLPGWFSQRDRNGDLQLSQEEFAPTHSREAIKSFEQLDTNQDGLLTPKEATSARKTKSKKPAQPAAKATGGTE